MYRFTPPRTCDKFHTSAVPMSDQHCYNTCPSYIFFICTRASFTRISFAISARKPPRYSVYFLIRRDCAPSFLLRLAFYFRLFCLSSVNIDSFSLPLFLSRTRILSAILRHATKERPVLSFCRREMTLRAVSSSVCQKYIRAEIHTRVDRN